MLTPDDSIEAETTISINAGPSNYNSEWNKFGLLVWKNIRSIWTNWDHLVISILSPILFCTILVSLRISVKVANHPIESYPILNLSKYWDDLLKLIDERKIYMDTRIAGFTYSPFIPQKIVGYAPNKPGYKNIMEGARSHLQTLVLKDYETCDQLKEAIIKENLLAGACFDGAHIHHNSGIRSEDHEVVNLIGGLYPNHLKYRLIFPYACRIYHDTFIGISWNTNSLYHFINRSDQRNIGKIDGGYVGYIREGFAPLQNAISLAYLKLVAEVEKPSFQIPIVQMCRYPSREFQRDDVIESIDFSVSLMIVFGNIYPVLIFIASIVGEKEGKLKIYSRIIGINNYVHFLGWVVNFLLPSLISSFVVVVLLKIKWASEASILKRSGFFALFFVLSVYNMTSICFILMLASFYKQTNSAVCGAAIAWFVTYVPYIMSLSEVHASAWELNIFIIIFHNTALGFTLENILEFELFGEGFNFENLFDTRPLNKKISTGSFLCIMLFQCFVYTCISLYVEELIPGNFGLAKRWNFLFTFTKSTVPENIDILHTSREFRSGASEGSVLATNRPTPFIYEVGGGGSVVLVDIQNVSKLYANSSVLRNINLQLHDDEITILLGHNGSGKTTLLSMISGLRSITSGSIVIEGFDVHKDQRYACSSLGLCMGDTVLYPDLTVEDQIRFCSFLKGFEGNSVEREVEHYLVATKLTDYRKEYTRNLPLGVRQQLAICCALTGQSRVVLLDDPTTHMDLPARSLIWKLLEREKTDRTILIASTSANVLEGVGDRVAILSNGELQCDGTPVFIKKMYGHGYRLIITKGPQCNIQTVTNRVRQYIPNITPLSSLGNEVNYSLEESGSDVFDQLVGDLERSRSSLDIESVTLRPINIDDIFFKLAAADPSYENRTRLIEIMNGESSYPEESKNLRFMQIGTRVTGISRQLQHVRTIWRQRFLCTSYHKFYYLRRMVYPPIFVILAFLISAFTLSYQELPDIDFMLDQYESSVTLIEVRNIEANDIESEILDKYKELIFWLGIQHKLEETDGKLLSDYYLMKGLDTVDRMDQDHHVGVTFGVGYILAWFNNVALHSVPLSLNLVHNAILRAIYGDQCSIEITMEPLNNMQNYIVGLLRVTINTSNVLAVCVSVCVCCLWNSIVFLFIREMRSGYDNTQLLAGTKIWVYWLVNISYDTIIILCMTILTTLTIVLCQYRINVDQHIYGWYAVVLMMSGWCLYSLNYMMSQFFVNPEHAYAISLSFQAFGIICFCHIIEAFEKGYVNTAKSPYTMYFLFLPMFAFCSALSTIYYNGEFQRICLDEHIRMTSIYLENCKATPNCCLNFNMLSFKNGILMELIALIVTISICWGIILITDYHHVCSCKDIPRDDYQAQLNDHKRRHDNTDEDRFGVESAYLEHYAIQRMKNAELRKIPLVCDRLGKNIGQHRAVDRLSLILDRYNCFGILGVSGSGVTTLLNLITGFEEISYGRVLTKGRDVAYNFELVSQLVGYGKQTMINFPELTVQDVLEFICNLRSYPPQYVDEICVNLAKVLGIFPYYHKHLNILSLGILNRLNCAIAVMGNPQIIILDMALAGIDSAGKREVWNILKRMQSKGASILAATTSLRDCERYCSRVGFMSHGRLCLIGTPWSLDKLFEDNHLLKVKFSRSMVHARSSLTSNYLYAASLNKLIDFIYKTFPNATLKEHHGSNFLFLIPVHCNTISHIFTTLMRNADFLNIEDFELTHCSLSQAFIQFWENENRLIPIGERLSLWNDSF